MILHFIVRQKSSVEKKASITATAQCCLRVEDQHRPARPTTQGSPDRFIPLLHSRPHGLMSLYPARIFPGK